MLTLTVSTAYAGYLGFSKLIPSGSKRLLEGSDELPVVLVVLVGGGCDVGPGVLLDCPLPVIVLVEVAG